jgi:hypothetical protein
MSKKTTPVYTRGAALPAVLEQRIAIIDGAMGTMIQRYKLGEADFRGERFAANGKDLKGNNDLLVLTRPDIIRTIHSEYLAAGADLIETNTFGATSVAQEDYGLGHIAREMNVAAARVARDAVDAHSTPDRPPFVAGALPDATHGQHQPDVNDPGCPQHQLRRTACRPTVSRLKACSMGGSTCSSSKRYFDTLERQGRDFCTGRADGRNRRAVAGDCLGHCDGRLRPHPQRADGGGFLAFGATRTPPGHRPELARWAPR